MGYKIDKIKKIEMYNRITGEKIGEIVPPPSPNIKMIISPGDGHGKAITALCFYRHKCYNWFQRLMYRVCFGIIIKQGDEVRHEFLHKNF